MLLSSLLSAATREEEIGNGVLGVQLNPRPFYYCPVDRLSVAQTVGRVIRNIRGDPPISGGAPWL